MNKYEFNSKFTSRKEIRKIRKVETIEDKDEYLVNRKIINHEPQKIKPKKISIENNIPTYVATPLPPLNFNQNGKT